MRQIGSSDGLGIESNQQTCQYTVRRERTSMTNNPQSPPGGDTLGSEVVRLLRRLKQINPDHELLQSWSSIFGENGAGVRGSPVLTIHAMKQTDSELLELRRQLERLLKPRLCYYKRRPP